MMRIKQTGEFTIGKRYHFVIMMCIICGILTTVFGLNVFKTLSYGYYRNLGKTIVLDVSSIIEETESDAAKNYLNRISEENGDIESLSIVKFNKDGRYVVHDTASEHTGALEKWHKDDGFRERKNDILKGKDSIVYISGTSDGLVPTITVMKKYDSNADNSLNSYVCAKVKANEILSMIYRNCILVFVPIWLLIVLVIIFLFFDYRNSKRAEREYEEIIRKEEEVIRGALSKAENADAAKTAIFSAVSKATKEPRETILSMAASAMMNIDDTECVKECLSRISKAGEKLDNLVENILDISTIETRKTSLKLIETSIAELVHIIIDEARDKITEKNIKLDVIAKNIVHEAVVTDVVRLNGVFSNIMDNAVKYTGDGGTIRVSVSEKDCGIDGYAAYEFKISDNGIGMTEQYLEKIFEPFGSIVGSGELENKGFGMITAKNIVDMMGGKISIESEKNVGTTVFININLKISDIHIDKSCYLDDIHALILESDEADALAMSDMLKENGAECEIYLGRRKAIDAAASAMALNQAFNAVFIDNSIVEKEDIDILEALKPVIAPGAKLISMSPYKLIKNKDLTDRGVTGVLRKPLFKSDLYSVLDT